MVYFRIILAYNEQMKILGIDPGLATLGYGIIETKNADSKKKGVTCVAFGTIKTPQDTLMGKRLGQIERELVRLIKEFKPDIACIETLFFFMNQKTIIQIGQVHGILALTFFKRKIPIVYYPPLKIKNVLTGNGRAKKPEVQEKVGEFLQMEKKPTQDDAADALAVAICHILSSKKKSGN